MKINNYTPYIIIKIMNNINNNTKLLIKKGCNFRFTPIDGLMHWRETVEEKSNTQEKDLMAFIRIVRVHVTETKHILSTLYFIYFPRVPCLL